jgi:hypothetical protein
MYVFEAEPVHTDLDNGEMFEDVTLELYSAVDSYLGDMELICAPHFAFQDTMTSFEVGNVILDLRFLRHKVVQDHQE